MEGLQKALLANNQKLLDEGNENAVTPKHM